MEHIYDMIIIGGGPAGYSAALYAARAGLDSLLIEKMSPGGQMALTGDIDNYPGFADGIDGFTLGMEMKRGAERFGAKTEYDEVISTDLSGKIKRIMTENNSYFAKTVLISTGAAPRRLGIESESELVGRGVHYCAHCDGRFYKDKTVVVVGGGNSAAQDALLLSRLAKKVYLIHRRDSLRATKIYQKPLFEAENIELVLDSRIEQLVAEDELSSVAVKNLINGESRKIACDGLFVSVGREPVTSFLDGALALDELGYVIADESTKTNIDGVFAIGDVRTKPLRQVVTAASDGAVAVHMAEEYLLGR